MSTNIQGQFDVTVTPDPPFDVVDGVSLGRVRLEKRFHGPLDATSKGEMIGARTAVAGSAGYVAIERVSGSLAGRTGTFVLQHLGMMKGGKMSLDLRVVPDSGTGELAGLSGTMTIDIVDGKHFYGFDYALEAPPETA